MEMVSPRARSMGKGKKTRRKIAYRIPLRNKETGQRIKISVFKPEHEENAEQEQNADPRSSMVNAATTCWQAISQNLKEPTEQERKAQAATKFLIRKGCDWVQVLALIEQISQYPNSELKESHDAEKDFLRKLSKKVAKFESTVTKWEASIREINSEIEELLHVDVTAHSPDFDAYRAALRVAQTQSLPSGRKPNVEKESIVYLYHLVRLSTGQPHYAELTDILQARLNVGGADRILGELKNTVKSYRRENAPCYCELEKAAKVGLQLRPFAADKLP